MSVSISVSLYIVCYHVITVSLTLLRDLLEAEQNSQQHTYPVLSSLHFPVFLQMAPSSLHSENVVLIFGPVVVTLTVFLTSRLRFSFLHIII